MPHTLTFVRGVALTAALLLTLPAAAADTPAQVNLRGGVHSSFDRLVFDWPRNVSYRLTRSDNRVTLSFNTPARFNTQNLTRNRITRAGGYTQSSDTARSSFSFTVAPETRLVESRSGTYVIVDLVNPKAGTPTAQAQTSTPTPAPTPTSSTASTPAAQAAIQTTPQPEPSPIAPLALLALPSLPVVTALEPPEPVRQTVALPAPATPVEPAAPVASAATPAEPAAPITPAAIPDSSVPKPPQTLNDVAPLSASPIKLPGPDEPPLAILQLNPGMQLALAAYARGGYGYIILERQLTLDMKQLISGQNPLLVLQPLHLAGATGFRFLLPINADLRVSRTGNTWVVYLASERRHVPVSLGLNAEPNYALGPRLLLPIVNPSNVIRFIDPVIGDTLSIVPLLRAGDAMTTPRHYADLTILTSAQGMVVNHLNDQLNVRKVANGIEISATGGLRLSSTEDTGVLTTGDNIGKDSLTMLLDYRGWRGLKGETFIDARQRLFQNIADVLPAERDRLRIELARLYFVHGYGTEAWALLNHIGAKLPDLFARPEYRILHGAARTLAGDADGGLEDLAMEELANVPDRILWEALALAIKRDYVAAAPKFNASINLIDKLPEPLFTRFATLALESLIATKQTAKAEQWLENWRLSRNHDTFLATPAASYLRGAILYNTGNHERAVKEWRVAAASNDRLYRTRAELVLVDYDMVKGKLTAAAAAQRLEGLRFAWRGDALEWDILHRLTLYDFQAGKFRDGFANFERANKLYPDLADSGTFKRAIADKFRDILTTNLGAGLTALEALSLYQDYRYLITDPVEARPIIRALTERLVAIDLLDQATQLLEDLLLVTKGVDKAHLGARLAGIHLLNHQPDKALAALTSSQSDGLDETLIQERQLLQARARSDLHDTASAKSLLANRTDPPALLLLGDIAWRAALWPEAAAAFWRALGTPPAADKPLSGDQAALAVKTATALALADDRPGLEKLAAQFGTGMAATPQHEIFVMLTHPEDSANIRDIAQATMQASDSDLFRKFLDRYRGAPAPEPAKAKP
ncbi:MAG: hypothetical protein WBK91_07855 [Alphaproteobacteria bacterium]